MSSSGSGNVTVEIPASVKGNRTITATGNMGNSATTTFNVKQSAYVSSGTPQPGNNVRVQYRGYIAGQTVTMRFDTQSGTVLGTGTASATGSGSHAGDHSGHDQRHALHLGHVGWWKHPGHVERDWGRSANADPADPNANR